MAETRKCCLVVLGRTGVGKSSVVNQILGKSVFPVSSALESTTRKTRTLKEEVMDEEQRVEYKIKILDTVGLKNKAVKSKDIMKDIKDYFSTQQVPEGVNLIFFVTRKGILNEEETQAFHHIIANYEKEIQDISALVITGCEGLDDDGREEVIQEMKRRHDTKTFVEFMGKGIFPVGFPSIDNVKPELKKMYTEDMEADAKTLRNVVLNSSDMRLLNHSSPTFSQTLFRLCSLL